jgi:hypothetical protein
MFSIKCQVGCNYQFAPNLVIGIEGDVVTRSGNSMRDALPQGLRTSSGSLAMFAAMRLVSSAQR